MAAAPPPPSARGPHATNAPARGWGVVVAVKGNRYFFEFTAAAPYPLSLPPQ
jgi:hypothetical protein